MTVTIDFYGGLFLSHRPAGALGLFDVHLWRPLPIRIEVNQRREAGLEARLSSAGLVHFRGVPWMTVDGLPPIRELSSALPVDYESATRVVRLEGGRMRGAGPPVPERTLNLFEEAKASTNLVDRLRAFRQLSGVRGRPNSTFEELADGFFRQDREALRYWQPGYHIWVELEEATFILDGEAGSPHPIPEGSRIVFDVEESSTIPHPPADNPHVLERPPSRRRGKK